MEKKLEILGELVKLLCREPELFGESHPDRVDAFYYLEELGICINEVLLDKLAEVSIEAYSSTNEDRPRGLINEVDDV